MIGTTDIAARRVVPTATVTSVQRCRPAAVGVTAVQRCRATAVTPPAGRDVVMVTLTRDGRLANDTALARVAQRLSGVTDCFLFCHGWLYDEAEARQEAARFFALLDVALLPLRERIVPLRVGLHWPSKPFGDPSLARGATDGGLWPELERRVVCGSRRRGAPSGVARLLADLCGSEIPASAEEDAELDALARQMTGAGHGRGAPPISPFQALSFWVMKHRAGEVGERFGRESLAPLWASLQRAPRLNLIGHSFGAKLVTSIVLGGVRAESLTLLLAAFSAFAFARDIPGSGRPGFYHRVLAERRVAGPIAVLRSDHDTALATFYAAISGGGEVGRQGARPSKPGGWLGRMTATVATSALGAAGARGVGAPEFDLVDVQRSGIPRHAIVNVDGSRVVKASDRLLGAHRDIHHREIAVLCGMAAGLLAGSPDGPRPRPLDPLIDG